ncbi:hypothetical protein I547_3561 [Mycobacterium kansasii 824]|nr:hypothetical protein I547_3561 [Mycobacterium kansasii 824]KEP39799.1 hypothetical protein MKSMC1_50420 [Mycobacterium kansasii]
MAHCSECARLSLQLCVYSLVAPGQSPDWLTGRMRPVFHRRSRRPHHHIAHID